MEPFWTEISAIRTLYKEGHLPEAIETAREDVAKVLGARAKKLFYGRRTESDNLAILGVIGSANKFSSKTKAEGILFL